MSDIRTIASFVSKQDIHSLDNNISLNHLPDNDEIKIIADSINTMTDLLDVQISQIRRFVSNLSHEIKTPLMASRTHAELALKTGDYEQ